MKYENENIEFKETFIPEIYKEVIAFANTNGGTIFVGVDDNGNSIGLNDIDDTYTKITNGIRDAILPDITMFIRYKLAQDNTIRIDVNEGAFKPYYLKSKGLKSSGVYVRQGASSAPASQEQIRQMIKYADGDTYEKLRSLNQNLSLDYAKKTFEKHSVEFNPEKYIALGLRSPENKLFTNLAFLLSDQCTHSIKVGVFSDKNNTVFKDKKEFSGSVLEQLENTYNYLSLCNQNRAVISGLERKDNFDYDESALREALINAIIHRDYSFNGSIIINVNDYEIEFISIGGLLPGIYEEDIHNGISISRNRDLSEIFHRLKFIESYGTGIKRIFSVYENCDKKPEIKITPNSFKITLPNMNNTYRKPDSLKTSKKTNNDKLSKQKKNIINYISDNGEISLDGVKRLLNIRETRAYVVMKELTDSGIVEKEGRGKEQKFKIHRLD